MEKVSFFEYVKADLRANRGGAKFQLFCLLFRTCSLARRSSLPWRLLCLPIILIYKIYSEILLSIEIPTSTNIGPGLAIRHGFGIVVHSKATLGANVILRQGVTIGARRTGESLAPSIGNDVEFGVNSVTLGDIHIGSGAKIGAGAVVLHSVPEGAFALGVPARIKSA